MKMNEFNDSTEYYRGNLSAFVIDTESFTSMKRFSLAPQNISLSPTVSMLNGTYANATNATLELEDWRDIFKIFLDWMLLSIIIVAMLSMGCEITWKNLLSHFKRPFGLCIGMVSQFLMLPASAYCILRLTGISGLHATGVLIIACCPGGAFSNIVTYLWEGDLSLSVAMTSFSIGMAMAMMPLNLWMYGSYFETEDIVIPYKKMAMSLIIVTSPVFAGMLVKWKIPRLATVITKIGVYCVLIITFATAFMEVIMFPNMFTEVSVKVYAVILTFPIIGFNLGYCLAYLCKQTTPLRKTIAVECGIQNVPLALTVVALSFPIEMQGDIVLIIWLYGFSMLVACAIICLTYRFIKKYSPRNKKEKVIKNTLGEVPLLEDGNSV